MTGQACNVRLLTRLAVVVGILLALPLQASARDMSLHKHIAWLSASGIVSMEKHGGGAPAAKAASGKAGNAAAALRAFTFNDCTSGTTCTIITGCTAADSCTSFLCTSLDSSTTSFYCTKGFYCTLGKNCTTGTFCTYRDNCTKGTYCTKGPNCTKGGGTGCTTTAACTGNAACVQ